MRPRNQSSCFTTFQTTLLSTRNLSSAFGLRPAKASRLNCMCRQTRSGWLPFSTAPGLTRQCRCACSIGKRGRRRPFRLRALTVRAGILINCVHCVVVAAADSVWFSRTEPLCYCVSRPPKRRLSGFLLQEDRKRPDGDVVCTIDLRTGILTHGQRRPPEPLPVAQQYEHTEAATIALKLARQLVPGFVSVVSCD